MLNGRLGDRRRRWCGWGRRCGLSRRCRCHRGGGRRLGRGCGRRGRKGLSRLWEEGVGVQHVTRRLKRAQGRRHPSRVDAGNRSGGPRCHQDHREHEDAARPSLHGTCLGKLWREGSCEPSLLRGFEGFGEDRAGAGLLLNRKWGGLLSPREHRAGAAQGSSPPPPRNRRAATSSRQIERRFLTREHTFG